MTRPEYYCLLDVPCSADAATIKRAYREQALRHHPDKHMHRLHEATERFKLIGEAYSVLRDPEQRAAYDRVGRADGQGWQCSRTRTCNGDFSLDRARELFRDVFGDDVTAMVARAAECTAPHLRRAAEATASGLQHIGDHMSRTKLAHYAVASHLSSLTDDASSDAAAREREADLCKSIRKDASMAFGEADLYKNTQKACIKRLEDHQAMVDEVGRARKERKFRRREALQRKLGLWQTRQQIADAAFDCKAAATMDELRRELRNATLAWCKSLEDVADAEDVVFQAAETEANVRHDGVSLKQATEAGKYFFRGFVGRVDQGAPGLDNK